MKVPMFQILNERTRRTREWQKFREDERSRNYDHKRSNSTDRGKLRVPGDEPVAQRDGTEPEQPLDGNLHW
jgi:hypothetical protein